MLIAHGHSILVHITSTIVILLTFLKPSEHHEMNTSNYTFPLKGSRNEEQRIHVNFVSVKIKYNDWNYLTLICQYEFTKLVFAVNFVTSTFWNRHKHSGECWRYLCVPPFVSVCFTAMPTSAPGRGDLWSWLMFWIQLHFFTLCKYNKANWILHLKLNPWFGKTIQPWI